MGLLTGMTVLFRVTCLTPAPGQIWNYLMRLITATGAIFSVFFALTALTALTTLSIRSERHDEIPGMQSCSRISLYGWILGSGVHEMLQVKSRMFAPAGQDQR